MKKILTLILILTLTGCSSQRFNCPYTGGVRCQSVGDVDKQINSGEIGRDNKSKKPFKKLEPKKVPTSMLRTQEEVLSVWVAPYQTEDGTFHEEKVMHFVARPAEWVVDTEVNMEQN